MAFSGRLSDAQWTPIARLLVRHERLLSVYTAFFHLACAMLTLRRVLK